MASIFLLALSTRDLTGGQDLQVRDLPDTSSYPEASERKKNMKKNIIIIIYPIIKVGPQKTGVV